MSRAGAIAALIHRRVELALGYFRALPQVVQAAPPA